MRAVVVVTVMHVLLFVLHVCVLWECEGARVTAGVLSRTGDVLVRGVDGVFDMCMCLARAGVGGEGGEWMRKLGLALPILWGQRECWTCVCVLVAVVWVV